METANIQRQNSVTVSNPIASTMPTQQDCRQSAAAFVVVSGHLDASYFLCQRLHCRCCSLCTHLSLPTPPSLSYIPWTRCLDPTASVFVSDPLDASYIPCTLLTPLLFPLSPRACLTLPTPPLSSSIPRDHKCTGTSAVGDDTVEKS